MIDNPVLPKSLEQSGAEENEYVREVLNDFWTCCVSRETSLLGRKEVLTGKAKFGILGDGKEVPQVAMARAFKKGDWRSGYYRDQTFMFALGISTVEAFFAQLYADTENDPFSGGRQMNSHFATATVDQNGEWTNHQELYNISSDISCTAGQMARGLGLALASKKYRQHKSLKEGADFSNGGNEVCFVTIGDASTSEGIFWETINAAGVMQVPMAVSVWDDGYGISVPKEYQTTKGSISKALAGMQKKKGENGIDIYHLKGWDYPVLREAYEKGIEKVRTTHIPAIFHIDELTQPQGHSTSGSHERYKSEERLSWEKEHDCIKLMRAWIIEAGIATEEVVNNIADEAKVHVKEARNRAWKAYMEPVKHSLNQLKEIYGELIDNASNKKEVNRVSSELRKAIDPVYSTILQNARRMLFFVGHEDLPAVKSLKAFVEDGKAKGEERYHTRLYSDSKNSALNVPVVAPEFTEDAKLINGYQILNKYFDKLLEKNASVFAFGEDVGHIGDVNQGFAGLQKKYGNHRVFDTGIREWSIMGQAIGMAMRGLRPIAEIQYLDYLIYGLEPLSDDLATLRYRSNGLQQAPAIIRTRGHRLEGIWHAGSPMSMLLGALRGIYICVPRNMTQAAGMYNTLVQSDDPGLVIECLNGYRLKEKLPNNIGEFTVPLGVPEVLSDGGDVTVVTYGACVRVVQEAMVLLSRRNISVELIDVQTLLPFDLEHRIVASLQKTNRIVFVDEDVPGGATAYMLQEVLEKQNGYRYLDSAPLTISAKSHRPPFGSDGDYFSKPNPEEVFNGVYGIMHEVDPQRYPEM